MPPSSSRTHYDLLGVPRNAPVAEIKKRYRELARQHHPDVNPGNADAARRFAEITAAYKTLSDADARAVYDADLMLAERRAQAAAARAASAGKPRPAAGTAPGAPPRPAASGTTASPNEQAARLVQQAQAALVRMKFVEARDLAQQSLRIRRSAEGYEVLGDVYRLQGRSDEAMNMYTMSLQLNPRQPRVQERLERLARSAAGNAGRTRTERRFDTSHNSPYPSGGAVAAPRMNMGAVRDDKRPLALLLVGVVGYSLVFFLVLYLAFYGTEAPLRPLVPLPFLSGWNAALLTVLPLSALILGATMAITQAIRRVEDELVFGVGGGHNPVPMGVLLLVLSLFSFWAAALLHLILSALQEARVDSILRVFGAVAALVLMFTALYEPARTQVFFFGGNLAFLSFVFGWFLGDIFRPDL